MTLEQPDELQSLRFDLFGTVLDSFAICKLMSLAFRHVCFEFDGIMGKQISMAHFSLLSFWNMSNIKL